MTTLDATAPRNKRASARTGVLLVVDDDENIRSALRRLFGPQGYRVLMAEEGHAALGVLERESIDVLITDMRMPGMDGSELLRRVTRRWPRMVRILLTGYADLQLTTQAIRDGYVDHFLTKPWELAEIERCVEQGLRARDKRLSGREET